MSVNEGGGVSVRIPGRDSSLSSVSLWCYFKCILNVCIRLVALQLDVDVEVDVVWLFIILVNQPHQM